MTSRDHAARILVVHGNLCTCDFCRWSTKHLKRVDPRASVRCVCCDELGELCAPCACIRADLLVDLCPRCRVARSIVLEPRSDRVICFRCGWSGSGILARGRRCFPPRLRIVEDDLNIPF